MRKRALVGVLCAIVVGGGAYVFAQGQLGSMRARIDALQARRGSLRVQYADTLRREARLDHTKHFIEADVDWLAHIAYLAHVMPDTSKAILDRLHGSLEAAVLFSPRMTEEDGQRHAQYAGGEWSQERAVRIVLDGRVHARTTADALRDTLLASQAYTVNTQGPDAADAFSFALLSGRADPAPETEGGS